VRQGVTLAEAEEQRADLAADLGVDDAEQRRPAAARAFTPHRQHRAAPRAQHAVQLAQRGLGVGQVHQSQRAQRDVEAGVGQRELLGFHACEAGLGKAEALRTLLSRLHHRVRDVDAQHTTRRPDGARRGERHHAGAAGHVEHGLASVQVGHRQQLAVNTGQRRVPVACVRVDRTVPAIALDPALQAGLHRRLRRV
jgi:hypothetical protein